MTWGTPEKMVYLKQINAPILKQEPQPLAGSEKYFRAFSILNQSRNEYGMIPFSEMKSYIELFGIEDKHGFIRILQAMDQVYRELKEAENGNK